VFFAWGLGQPFAGRVAEVDAPRPVMLRVLCHPLLGALKRASHGFTCCDPRRLARGIPDPMEVKLPAWGQKMVYPNKKWT